MYTTVYFTLLYTTEVVTCTIAAVMCALSKSLNIYSLLIVTSEPSTLTVI